MTPWELPQLTKRMEGSPLSKVTVPNPCVGPNIRIELPVAAKDRRQRTVRPAVADLCRLLLYRSFPQRIFG
jgi:hypothetical protein